MVRPPLLLGHRGARATRSVPENTLASFDLALKHGCDGFEFDVRLKACGRAVICHDEVVDGITVATSACNQLTQLPELRGLVARYASRAFLNIELKVPGLESIMLVVLGEQPPQRGYIVSSFLPEVLKDLRVRSGSVVLGLICDKREQLDSWREAPVQIVIPHYSLITPNLVEQLHGAERSIVAWTVNDSSTMLKLRDWRVDGIISDDTELLVKTLGTDRSPR
jgi:glycerophosphoryl diester phosphodiesterase